MKGEGGFWFKAIALVALGVGLGNLAWNGIAAVRAHNKAGA